MENPSALPIKLQPSNLRPIAYRILSKKHGLNIQTDALKLLTDAVSYKFGFDWKSIQSQQFLDEIAKIWKNQDRGIFIDGPGLKQVIKELSDRNSNQKSIRNGSADNLAKKAERSDTLVDDDAENEAVYNEEITLNWQDYFKVINPDEQPNYKYDKHRKQLSFIPSTNAKRLANNLNSNVDYFNNRYHLISDRLSRNENFQKPSFSSISSISKSLSHNNKTNEITLIKNVLGRDGSKFILFGLLSKNANDDFILEDSTDHIELNLTQAYKTQGSFYCPGMFVIVEGIYSASGGSMSNANVIGGCFHVSNIGHPPAERRELSLENYGNLDFMGINRDNDTNNNDNHILRVNKSLKKKLVSLEKNLVNHKLIILGSDCFLDDLKILDGIKKLFGKIESSIIDDETNQPLVIVLIGSFTSNPLTPTNSSVANVSNTENYKSNFDNLSNILSNFPNIVQKVKIALIPGINDPWQSSHSLGGSNLNAFPQRSIPKIFTNRLERLLPKGSLIAGWNPLRINYLSQEIVLMKDDIISKFKRNDIIFSNDLELEQQKLQKDKNDDGLIHATDINTKEPHISPKIKQARKLVKTILDQGNLQPFLKDIRIINTNFDYSLRIEPLPTVLILNDATFPTFEVTYNGCKVINTGKLVGNNRKLSFVEYFPSGKRFEFKEVYF